MVIIEATQEVYDYTIDALEEVTEVFIIAEEVGVPGEPGANAYQVAVANGYVGTEAEFVRQMIGHRWIEYVFGYKTKTKLPDLPNGKLIRYTFEGATADVTLWRFKAFNKSIDAFYTDAELTDLVIKKRIKI